ncbi:TlpA family protein disulfide reductase [Fimbriimonas ginsengisoli]|uniref:Thioredoxin family protein n=1 Tax=Fimbriimonas ginsengisoli Gsoil 348 TaxID=661478 RepID=A0A068NL10_FIMGI|nr:TlpA disulfide reductase family protein [Fimbriimonas ginsengisoli]AIE84092.1 thioredoxin family protein [Fimbriimonas ginsengisoli Gsoil 348]
MILLSFIISGLALGGPGDVNVKFQPMADGAMRKIGYYMPQRLQLSFVRPAGIKKLPAGLTSPKYGTLAIGGKKVCLILDEPAGKPARLFVDTNGDGDLTNDKAPEWKQQANKLYMGSMQVPLMIGGSVRPVTLSAYRFDPADRPQFKNTILYYRDYAVKGEMKLGSKTYPVILSDETASGNFASTAKGARTSLLIDRNADGRFMQEEMFDVSKPFNLDGTTYKVGKIATDGSSLQLVKSDEEVAEVPLPPDVSLGKNVLPFQAETTSGQKIDFPTTYKGKVVMLDFWATWCGPCVAELPNVKKAYAQLHDKGFEILSISLDQKGDGPKLAKFTKDNDMPWNQVYDGGFWDARVAKLYGVHAIPFVILVDGDTGKIIANETTLRGPQIVDTITKALKSKGIN